LLISNTDTVKKNNKTSSAIAQNTARSEGSVSTRLDVKV